MYLLEQSGDDYFLLSFFTSQAGLLNEQIQFTPYSFEERNHEFEKYPDILKEKEK
jgi:hypothetical protein